MDYKIKWPGNKKFAFTIFDDTDLGTVKNLPPIYAFLKEKGFRTTKSVWAVEGKKPAKVKGATCEDKEYLEWLYKIEKEGFEIASHGVSFCTATRDETIEGYKNFYELFGHNPASYATHTGCAEGIYNGKYRVSGLNRMIFNFLTRYKHDKSFRGHIEGDELFWGDICKERIKYMRGYVFGDINTLKACPYMPYHDPRKKYVNYWFASSEGAVVDSFNKTISEKNQDRLEEEGGACIMYTHLACGFAEGQKVNSRFEILMDRLSKKNGWFVPVNELLDYINKERGRIEITPSQGKELERRWLIHKIFAGAT